MSRAVNVLSVDWDFFLPNMNNFDWGHQESFFFLEQIWSFRVNTYDLITKEIALEVMWPDKNLLKNFWPSVIGDFRPRHLIICDSHLDLCREVLEMGYDIEVTNYDQHSDLGYTDREDFIDCSNWAKVLLEESLIDKYRLHYPEWRKDAPEGTDTSKAKVTYGLPDKPKYYDIVFICRSSAWTPTWCDDLWLEFIEFWRHKNPYLWQHKKCVDFVLQRRSPNYDEAIVLSKLFTEEFEKMRSKLTCQQPGNKLPGM